MNKDYNDLLSYSVALKPECMDEQVASELQWHTMPAYGMWRLQLLIGLEVMILIYLRLTVSARYHNLMKIEKLKCKWFRNDQRGRSSKGDKKQLTSLFHCNNPMCDVLACVFAYSKVWYWQVYEQLRTFSFKLNNILS